MKHFYLYFPARKAEVILTCLHTTFEFTLLFLLNELKIQKAVGKNTHTREQYELQLQSEVADK